jgi:AcrR family transcriptional regulator
MTREAILDFVREYYVREGTTPSVRAVAEAVSGVDRANFYDLFASKNELLFALGIEPEESDLPQTAAMEARKDKSNSTNRHLMSELLTNKLYGISHLDGVDPSIELRDMFERDRQIRMILDEIDAGNLTPETIDKMLNPPEKYYGINVSGFSHKPWIALPCRRCGKPTIYGEALDPVGWPFFMRDIREILRAGGSRFQHKKCPREH